MDFFGIIEIEKKKKNFQIYITSDGGGTLDMIYELVPKLNQDIVEIVSPKQLTDFALKSSKKIKWIGLYQ